jgi:hypothetical protein
MPPRKSCHWVGFLRLPSRAEFQNRCNPFLILPNTMCPFSPGCEDTSSVVAVVLTRSALILTSRLPISAAQYVPKWSGTTVAGPPPPPSGRLSSRNGARLGTWGKENAARLEIKWLIRELERLTEESERLATWIKSTSDSFQEGTGGSPATNETPSAERATVNEKLAYCVKDASFILGIGRTSLWLEVARCKIFVTPTHKLIPRKKLLRCLAEEEQLARRQRRRSKNSKVTQPPGSK